MTSKALSTKSIKSKSTSKPAQKANKVKHNKLMSSLPTAKQGDVSSDKDEEEEAWAGIGEPQEDEANDDSHLHGFSSDDDDSSDEDMIDGVSVVDISKLPTIAKDDSTVALKLEKAKRQSTEDRGILYLGRIPHGFYEDQMRSYFSQFGTVTRIRLARNKKTGRSKHYGFIEFDSAFVAQIVADTMDNYLLMGHILRCKVIPKDEVHPELWIGANRKWRPVPQDRVIRVKHNKPRSEDEQARAVKRLLKRQNERKRKLVEAGIKYDFEAVGYKKVVPAT